MPVLLQMDFKATSQSSADGARARAESINHEPGFIWKIWTYDEKAQRPGGVYLFDSEENARKYMAMHRERMARVGAEDIRFSIVEINEELSTINHGPIHVRPNAEQVALGRPKGPC